MESVRFPRNVGDFPETNGITFREPQSSLLLHDDSDAVTLPEFVLFFLYFLLAVLLFERFVDCGVLQY